MTLNVDIGDCTVAEVMGTEGVDLVARVMARVPAGVAPAGR